MTSLISGLLAYLLLYKYITLFIVCYLAALLIPLPSNTSLLAASAFASQGYLNIYIVIAVALAANVLGDITGFLLARRFGKEFLMKVGFKKIILSKRCAKVHGHKPLACPSANKSGKSETRILNLYFAKYFMKLL